MTPSEKCRPSLVDQVMTETISYGGFAMTRWQVYQDMKRRGFNSRCCDFYAFRPAPLTASQIACLIPADRFAEVTAAADMSATAQTKHDVG